MEGSAGRSERNNFRWILKHECQFRKWTKRERVPQAEVIAVYSKQETVNV